MDANQFNIQYEHSLVRPLREVGFRVHGQSLSYTKNQTVLAMLRLQMKFSSLTQSTRFLLCIRHEFLRTLERHSATKFLTNPSEYPFKLPVSALSQETLNTWHYEPINLGPRNYDTLAFGELNDTSAILAEMAENIINSGLAWMAYLSPAEALSQIKKHGESAYAEKGWIEDYEAFLKSIDATIS